MHFLSVVKKWLSQKIKLDLLKWSGGFFSCATLFLIAIGLFYISVYSFPSDILGIIYTITAFTSHFASITLGIWLAVIIPVIFLFPFKKIIIPLCVLLVSTILCIELLDAQLFTTRRFHLGLLTMRILGWKTWGFGIFYLFMFLVFNSFIAQICWKRFVVDGKRLYLNFSIPITLIFLTFTHVAHIWADATGYVEITRFTTSLPLFYPSTSKRFMIKHGFVDIAERRNIPKKLTGNGTEFLYPKNPLQYQTDQPKYNILIIGIDAMRYDVMNSTDFPRTSHLIQQHGLLFTNHFSGGNSTKMGTFTLFYGIPPTYQQYVESHKVSPVLIDRLMATGYELGIFTSYKLYAPANLDVTAFVKVPDLRLETKIPDPQAPYRNDSAITAEWKEWLHKQPSKHPFFGFLFYDALCTQSYPPAYEDRITKNSSNNESQNNFLRYKASLQYIDSLVASVLENLSEQNLMDSTVVIITSDHGEEFDDNNQGYTGHGNSFSDWQIKSPLAVFWPGKQSDTITKRTSHYDIAATLLKEVLEVKNPESDYSSGNNLFSQNSWDYLLVGSYFNFAIVEPEQITIQFPGGYYEVRDRKYQILKKAPVTSNITEALQEMGRFFKH